MRTKVKPGFTCPDCAARLVVPVRTDGTYSSDLWLCPHCNKYYTADQIDTFRREQHADIADSVRPKRGPSLL